MRPFEFYAPTSLAEALEVLASYGERARPLAGGTDLLVQMREGRKAPQALVSLKRVDELRGLSFDPEQGLWLGARTTLREVTRSPLLREHYPCLVQAAAVMASEQVRSLATVGGNLCNASPAADLAPPLLALDAEAVIVGPGGERRLPLTEFFQGPGQTDLGRDELLKGLHLPPPRGRALYLKHAYRAYMDLAVVGVAVRLGTSQGADGARVALGAVALVPLRVEMAEAMLADGPPSPERLEEVARAAAAACSPIDDVRGSAWYRRRMVEVLTRRALEALLQEGKS